MFTQDQWDALIRYITCEIKYQIKDAQLTYERNTILINERKTINEVLVAEQIMQESYEKLYKLIIEEY